MGRAPVSKTGGWGFKSLLACQRAPCHPELTFTTEFKRIALVAPTSLAPYRPKQGVYARGVAGTALVLLSLFASVRFHGWLYHQLPPDAKLIWDIPYSACWAGLLFLVLATVSSLFAIGFRTGIKGIDAKTGAFVDLLIETETELQKVSWPAKDELVNSSTVVIVCMILIALFLFCVDQLVAFAMSLLKVLPG